MYRVLRVMGVFPITRDRPGETVFRLLSPAMAYSVAIFVILLVNTPWRWLGDLKCNLSYLIYMFAVLRDLRRHPTNQNCAITWGTFRRIRHSLSISGEYSAIAHCTNDLVRNDKIRRCSEWLEWFWGNADFCYIWFINFIFIHDRPSFRFYIWKCLDARCRWTHRLSPFS